MQRPKPARAGKRPDSARTPADIPAVSRLLELPALGRLSGRHGHRLVRDVLRDHLARLRERLRDGVLDPAAARRALAARTIAAEVARAVETTVAPAPRVVINATGVVIHTNLGRAVLSAEAAARVAEVASRYVDLEYDLARGRRGHRADHLRPLMARLFAGHDFVVVNNNAAAIMLALRALARGREVIVSRGELVEIGGSFRVPDILSASGARLREVGTTNRTRLDDYRAAVSPKSGALLKVHTSNFRVVGFAEGTSIEALASLARDSALPLVVDWGSGDLVDLAPLGVTDELPAADVLRAGADLVTFSGDKLLGGPQAGFVVGRAELIARLRRDPLARVCRVDRLTIAATHATLSAYVRGRAFDEVPTLRMLAAPAEAIGRRARRVRREVVARGGQGKLLRVVAGVSRTGGGSSPAGERPTFLLAVEWPGGDAAPLERRLRGGDPPLIGRLQEGRLLLDLRTVVPEQDARLSERLSEELAALGPVRR
ncbi:MAG TPA: L-seryl-tRNA(Sec) selenium transferase [Candidatus Polarisedimenticolaceae bacterium]|nr:L-seryl-tRNA(Sec) selenium transferase [Candidatus Polarisedimenticolaceae bacterium]